MSRWKALTQFTGDSYLQSMMGHGLRATSQSELIDKLIARGFLVLENPSMVEKLKTIDRARFAPEGGHSPYSNNPIPISKSHAMSTPQFHAQIISLLGPRLGVGRVAAEIGCGTGFLPAVMASFGCKKVFAVEYDNALMEISRGNLEQFEIISVSTSLEEGAQLDALYISPFLNSYEELEKLLTSWTFSDDAVVVAPVKDRPEDADQELLLLERIKNGAWIKTGLFRCMCEPYLVEIA
jgi:protein-L-isoaspartate O-methyltransferase